MTDSSRQNSFNQAEDSGPSNLDAQVLAELRQLLSSDQTSVNQSS